MGNPCRYIFDGKFMGRPKIDQAAKELTLTHYSFRGEQGPKDFYESVDIDFYSAPDVIMKYSNGNTCKDEFRRYSRDVFKNLRLIKKEEDPLGEYTTYVYTYDTAIHQWFNWDDPECETNIPLGKFQGMTYKEVQNYKRKNRVYFKGESPQPSPEAIEAACAAQPTSEWPLGLEDVKVMLQAAYKIDM
jgi:hypothetical protein